jgi:hypothetical protein
VASAQDVDPNIKEAIAIALDVENTSRSVGATASYHVSRLFGPDGLPHVRASLVR